MSINETQDLVTIIYNNEEAEVNREVAGFLDEYRRDMRRQRKQDSRHKSNVLCEEYHVESFMSDKPTGFEDDLIMRILIGQLPEAVATLSEVQHRRLTAYYRKGLTYQEIAYAESVSVNAVVKSIKSAMDKLKKYFGVAGCKKPV